MLLRYVILCASILSFNALAMELDDDYNNSANENVSVHDKVDSVDIRAIVNKYKIANAKLVISILQEFRTSFLTKDLTEAIIEEALGTMHIVFGEEGNFINRGSLYSAIHSYCSADMKDWIEQILPEDHNLSLAFLSKFLLEEDRQIRLSEDNWNSIKKCFARVKKFTLKELKVYAQQIVSKLSSNKYKRISDEELSYIIFKDLGDALIDSSTYFDILNAYLDELDNRTWTEEAFEKIQPEIYSLSNNGLKNVLDHASVYSNFITPESFLAAYYLKQLIPLHRRVEVANVYARYFKLDNDRFGHAISKLKNLPSITGSNMFELLSLKSESPMFSKLVTDLKRARRPAGDFKKDPNDLTSEIPSNSANQGQEVDPGQQTFYGLEELPRLPIDAPTLEECFFGDVPPVILDIIATLNNTDLWKGNRPEGILKRKLLLCGPPGTGKSTIARRIAERTGRKIFFKNGGNFSTSYKASEATSMRHLFNEAKNYGEPAIVFIDEIDGILSYNSNNENNREALASVKACISCLNELTDNNDIYVIATANSIDNIEEANRSRFRLLQIPFANYDKREKLIRHILSNSGIKVLAATELARSKTSTNEFISQALLDLLIPATNTMSQRCIEDIIYSSIRRLKNGIKITASEEEEARATSWLTTISDFSQVINLDMPPSDFFNLHSRNLRNHKPINDLERNLRCDLLLEMKKNITNIDKEYRKKMSNIARAAGNTLTVASQVVSISCGVTQIKQALSSDSKNEAKNSPQLTAAQARTPVISDANRRRLEGAAGLVFSAAAGWLAYCIKKAWNSYTGNNYTDNKN